MGAAECRPSWHWLTRTLPCSSLIVAVTYEIPQADLPCFRGSAFCWVDRIYIIAACLFRVLTWDEGKAQHTRFAHQESAAGVLLGKSSFRQRWFASTEFFQRRSSFVVWHRFWFRISGARCGCYGCLQTASYVACCENVDCDCIVCLNARLCFLLQVQVVKVGTVDATVIVGLKLSSLSLHDRHSLVTVVSFKRHYVWVHICVAIERWTFSNVLWYGDVLLSAQEAQISRTMAACLHLESQEWIE